MHERERQRGLSMIGFLFVAIVVVVCIMIGFRVAPAYIEYYSVTKALEEALSAGSNDHESLNRVVRKALGRLVGDRTRQRPMIVPVIVTV